MRGTAGTPEVLSLSVHGPVGIFDLHVPAGASSSDVATEYSRQANLPTVPALYTRLGEPLSAERTLAEVGLSSGAVLVALVEGPPPPPRRRGRERRSRRRPDPGPLSVLWCVVAVAAAVLAGALAAGLSEDSDLRRVTIGLLIGAAVVCATPGGTLAVHRVQAAPAFAGAAAFAIAWDPAPERLPTVIGVAGLAAAVAAAVARAFGAAGEEGLRVWSIAGVTVFVVSGLAALLDVEAQVVWALLLLTAMLSARFVPVLAVDVPDQYLLDLERLAVTAWSARDRPTGRRGRIVVPRQAVAGVAARGTRAVTAAAAAVLVVSTVSAVLLLREASVWIDVVGARCEVGLAGGALLLAARSYRHAAARAQLRIAGLACLAALLVDLFAEMSPRLTSVIATSAIALGALLVLVAVALGRGWRTAWWSRRAEVAESLCGALAIGSVVVAAGLFRVLWELTG